MSKSLLITRPRYDEATNYLYYWAEKVIGEAQKKNLTVLDLCDEKANIKDFTGRVEKLNPDLMFLNGHGDPNRITGQNYEVLVEKDKNETLLSHKITYALSCSAAKNLGQSAVKKGAKAFIGYKEDFIFTYEKDKTTKPIEDKTAKLFLEPSNLVVTTLIKGNTAKEANIRSKKEFRRNLRKLMASESPQEDQSPIIWLLWDIQAQVCLGDQSATI